MANADQSKNVTKKSLVTTDAMKNFIDAVFNLSSTPSIKQSIARGSLKGALSGTEYISNVEIADIFDRTTSDNINSNWTSNLQINETGDKIVTDEAIRSFLQCLLGNERNKINESLLNNSLINMLNDTSTYSEVFAKDDDITL